MFSIIERAVEARRRLLGDEAVEACRIVHGAADGIEGLYVDRYGQGAVMARHVGRFDDSIDPRDVACVLLDRLEPFGVRAIYDKPFARDRSQLGGERDAVLRRREPIAGTALEEWFIVREHDRTFEARLYDGFSTGLFLDQRMNRTFLARGCAGKRVLNTFCYTGSFSVACALAGASTTSVDVSSRYLEWAKRNFAHNQLDVSAHHFARMDTREFLDMAQRKGLRYDLVIIDPPTFASGDRRRGVKPWSAARDLGPLLAQARGLLNEGGSIFASTNASELCEGDRLKRLIVDAVGRVRWLDGPRAPEDFPGGGECARWALFARAER